MLEWILDQAARLTMAYDRAFAGSYTYAIIAVFWTLFRNLWYYMLLGSATGVLLSRLVTGRKVRSLLEARGMLGAALAALAGIASPACTFASVPVAANLLAGGFPAIPLVSFLIAAPLMNPTLFVVTWGVLGASMALARLVSAFLLAMGAAVVAQALARRGWLDLGNLVRPGVVATARVDGAAGAAPCPRVDDRLRPLWYEFYRMTWFVFRYFVLSLALAAVVQVLIPASLIARWLGGARWESAAVGGLLGIPFYICGGGAVATVAVLMSLRMGAGAALAFFLTGPATKVGTLTSLVAVMRPPLVALYLTVTLVGGTLLGGVYGLVAPSYQPHLVYAGQVEGSEDTAQYWGQQRPPLTWKWNR